MNLNEVKERMDNVSHLEWITGGVKSEDVYWLIEQAEKVEEYEKVLNEIAKHHDWVGDSWLDYRIKGMGNTAKEALEKE